MQPFVVDMGGEGIAVITAGTVTDPYSSEDAESWEDADVTEREVTTLGPPEPRPSDEPTQDARNAVVNGWTLYLPYDDPITRLDRVRVRGVVFPVQGEPARWGEVYCAVQAFRTEG